MFHKLVECSWIDGHDNLIICGPPEVGKSWLTCALGHKACRDNRSVYQRAPKLFADLVLARGDGRYARICRALFGVQLLILDDFALELIDAQARHAKLPPERHHALGDIMSESMGGIILECRATSSENPQQGGG